MMTFLRRSLLPGMLFSVAAAAWGQTPQEVARAALEQRLAKVPRGTQVGLLVQDSASGATWFSRDAELPLKPASVQKLFISAAALCRFGPNFTFRTPIYVRDGEVWVVGSGDPALGDERLAQRRKEPADAVLRNWAERVAAAGHAIQRIVLDDSVFDEQHRHPDWPADQQLAWYQAPVGGLNLNDNCLDVTVTVAEKRATAASVPALPPAFFVNRVAVGGKHAPRLTRDPGSDLFELSGTVAKSDRVSAVTVNRPSVFFGHALGQALAARGVAVSEGVVRRRISPDQLAGAPPLAVHATPLPDVLWRCNTNSQNLFAECLCKALAAYNADGTRSGTAGGWESGHDVIRAELARLGVDLSGATLRDGSGLSHENRVSAAQVVALLRAMRRHAHAQVFQDSLAAAGEDGSMKRRFADPVFKGRLRGKTGTLKGVSTLAGYAARPDGTVLAFALLVNGDGGEQLGVDVCRILMGKAK